MLSWAACLSRRWYLLKTRRAMPQLHLNFIDIPIAETCLWEQFDEQHKQILIETLARLLSKAARADQPKEQAND
jgi:hypothetical protein